MHCNVNVIRIINKDIFFFCSSSFKCWTIFKCYSCIALLTFFNFFVSCHKNIFIRIIDLNKNWFSWICYKLYYRIKKYDKFRKTDKCKCIILWFCNLYDIYKILWKIKSCFFWFLINKEHCCYIIFFNASNKMNCCLKSDFSNSICLLKSIAINL